MSLTHKVFVYGTLKKGEPNHSWLTNPKNGLSNFLSNGKTKVGYPLVIATRYNIPFLLDAPGKGHIVEGEIYEVDDQMLSNLDTLEEHPDLYERRYEPVTAGETRDFQCWTYFLKKFNPKLLQKEMFCCYSSSGSHNLTYCERYLREPDYNHRTEILPPNA